jgi:hypothetical protein
MTEQEWLNCRDPHKMLRWLGRRATERKLRLFACSCVRAAWDRLGDERLRNLLEVAEQYVGGQASQGKLTAAYQAAKEVQTEWWIGEDDVEEEAAGPEDAIALAARAVAAPLWVQTAASDAAYWIEWAGVEERAVQAERVRDVFNPFRRNRVEPAWLTPTVISLSEAAYSDRDLPSAALAADRLADLAAALTAAGCTDAELLAHLRSSGPHCRGCWPLDLVLGKG